MNYPEIAKNVLSILFLFVIGFIALMVFLSIIYKTMKAVHLIYKIWWTSKYWKPKVGDIVLVETLAGWREQKVTHIYDDGDIRLQSEIGIGGSYCSSPHDKEGLIFISRGEDD